MTVRIIIPLLAISLSLAVTQPAKAQEGTAAVQRIISTVTAGGRRKTKVNLAKAMADKADYDTMAQHLFSPKQWQQMTIAERTGVTTSVRNILERRYYKRWHKLYSRSQVQYLGETPINGGIAVRTMLNDHSSSESVTWQLSKKNGKLLVTDLNVDGKDLVDGLRDKVQKRLRRQGYDGVVTWLKTRTQTASSGSPTAE
jgi:ABC-type transporter MlaC component